MIDPRMKEQKHDHQRNHLRQAPNPGDFNNGDESMSKESSSSGGGIGFFGVLAIVFITLKLTGFIHWSWLWVLSPIWIPIAIIAVVLIVALTIYAIMS